MFCEKCGKPVEDGQNLCSSCAAQEASQVDETTVDAMPMDDTFALNTPDGAAEKKAPKKRRGLIAGIVAGSIAVACTLGVVFNLDRVKAFADRTFKSPEAYFVDVERAAFADHRADLTQAYGKMLNNYNENASAAKGEVCLTMGDTLLNLLETTLQQQGMQMDVDWLREIKLSVDTNMQEDAIKTALGIGLGKNNLLTADVILDVAGGKVYGAVPELNKDYVSFDLSSGGAANVLQETLTQSRVMSQKLIQALPSEEVLDNLLETYTDIVLTGIDDVDKQNDTIKVKGVSQKVVVLKAKITEADMLDITQKVLTKAQNDRELEKVIDAFGDYANEMGQMNSEYYEPVDLYQEFSDAVASSLDDLEDAKAEADKGNYMTLKTYVDMKNQIRGYELAVYSEGERQSDPITWLTAVEGNTTYTQAELGEVKITGEKTTKKDVSEGSYELSVDGQKLGALEFENVTENAGTLRLAPSEDLIGEALADSNLPASLLADNMALELTYSVSDSNKCFYELSVVMGSKSLVSLSLSAEPTTGGKISIPSNAVDAMGQEGLAQWLENVDFENVLKALEKAGVPQELVDTLRSYTAMLG